MQPQQRQHREQGSAKGHSGGGQQTVAASASGGGAGHQHKTGAGAGRPDGNGGGNAEKFRQMLHGGGLREDAGARQGIMVPGVGKSPLLPQRQAGATYPWLLMLHCRSPGDSPRAYRPCPVR
ncbi:hypothetical protein GCM10027256_13220 [Novispirillum itersonii subsp. nipponicum]